MAVAETAHEGRLVAHLKDLLNILELECALSHIILRVKWVVYAWHCACLVHALGDARVEVV